MRNLDPPVIFFGMFVRRRHKREVDGAVAIGADPEAVVEINDGIVDAGFAFGDQG